MLAGFAALVLNLAIGPNGTLVSDPVPASGLTQATHAVAPAVRPEKRCIAPADLPHDPSVDYRTAPGDVPADLPGPRFELPRKIELDLGQTVGPPAPDYSQLYLGGAEIDTKTGAVAIDGVHFSTPSDCP